MKASRAAFAALFVLALIGFGGLSSWRGKAPEPLAAGSEPTRIEVRRPREDLILTRAPGGWIVTRQDDLADSEAVEALLSGLRSLALGPRVAPDSESAAHGLGPADAARLRVLDSGGHALFDGYFGRRLFGRSSYFRAGDGEPVRVATGVEPDLLLRSSGQWREPRLLPGGCPGGLEIFARGAWRPVSKDRERELCSLRASHWATGSPEALAGFERPLLRVRTPDGRGFTVGDRRGNERLARVDGRIPLLRIPAAAIEQAAADLIRSTP
jgi:hypothetical protein